jgi:hypothetical protein
MGMLYPANGSILALNFVYVRKRSIFSCFGIKFEVANLFKIIIFSP